MVLRDHHKGGLTTGGCRCIVQAAAQAESKGGERRMRRILTIAILSLFVGWIVPAQAIEVQSTTDQKKETKEETQKKPTESQPAAKPDAAKAEGESAGSSDRGKSSLLENLKRQVKESKTSSEPKYDHFRDADKDGVSDNVQKRPATESAPAAEPEKRVKKPATRTTTTDKPADTKSKDKSDPPKRR